MSGPHATNRVAINESLPFLKGGQEGFRSGYFHTVKTNMRQQIPPHFPYIKTGDKVAMVTFARRVFVP